MASHKEYVPPIMIVQVVEIWELILEPPWAQGVSQKSAVRPNRIVPNLQQFDQDDRHGRKHPGLDPAQRVIVWPEQDFVYDLSIRYCVFLTLVPAIFVY